MDSEVADIGFTSLYVPASGEPTVDIIFVHGLNGHPFKTWALSNAVAGERQRKQKNHKKQIRKEAEGALKDRSSLKQAFTKLPHRLKAKVIRNGEETDRHKHVDGHVDSEASPALDSSIRTFWPRDLLPAECPNARILTWGYDSRVTKYYSEAVNKDTIFQYGKNLLYDLRRKRKIDRPIVWVAHSLGGIVVKQALAESHAAEDENEHGLRNVASSTAAIMFFATPHKGSPGLASIGEVARKAASAVLMDTNPALLDALGLQTTDIQRCQESFNRIWRKYDFQVKTFSEGRGLTRFNLGFANEKVVPDWSSSLEDTREHVETLDGNHMEICRLNKTNPNWRKVAGELKLIIEGIETDRRTVDEFDDAEREECIRSLGFPRMMSRQNAISPPCENTANWIQQNALYRAWHNRERFDEHKGFLWIKGKPGSGKSTIMKTAIKQSSAEYGRRRRLVVNFFFSAKGEVLQRTALGLYRSLAYQILKAIPALFQLILPLWKAKKHGASDAGHFGRQPPVECQWQKAELESFLVSVFEMDLTPPIVAFIDALDECQDSYETEVVSGEAREVAFFLQRLLRIASNNHVSLNSCFSSKSSFAVRLSYGFEVITDHHNRSDLKLYVRSRLTADIGDDDRQQEALSQLADELVDKSSGIFLWAKLALDRLLDDLDGGRSLGYVRKRILSLPDGLEQTFRDILNVRGESDEDQQLTVRFFQWVIFCVRPLSLREWRLIFAMIQSQPARSLERWRSSDHYLATDAQLEKRIRRISRGLVEVRGTPEPEVTPTKSDDCSSMQEHAGSLDLTLGENRIVEVIHESVREFFLDTGFTVLDASLNDRKDIIAKGHSTIIQSCIHYMKIAEFDELVAARGQAEITSVRENDEHGPQYIYRRGSVQSFSSAGSSRSHSIDRRGSVKSISPSRPPLSHRINRRRSVQSFSPARSPRPHNFYRRASVQSFSSASSSRSRVHQATARMWDGDPTILHNTPSDPAIDGIRPAPLTSEEGNSIADSEKSVKTQILGEGDVLGLFDFALHYIFAHATLALQWGADPYLVLLSFHSIWDRFVYLREDFKPGTSLVQCCLHLRINKLIMPALEWSLQSIQTPLFNELIFACSCGNMDGATRILLHQLKKVLGKKATLAIMQQSVVSRDTENQETGESFDQWRRACEQLICQEEVSEAQLLHVIDEVSRLSRYSPVQNKDAPDEVTESVDEGTHYGSLSDDLSLSLEADRFLSVPSNRTSSWLARCEPRHLKILSLLLDIKRDNFVLGTDCTSPFHRFCASTDLNWEAFCTLVENGSDVNMRNANGKTPLHLLYNLQNYHDDARRISIVMLKHGAAVNAQDNAERTPLHLVCSSDNAQCTAVISVLLQYGADINIKNGLGLTPLHLVCSSCNPQRTYIIDVLLQHGADPSVSDHCGRTPLHLVCRVDDSETTAVINVLLRHGADPNIKDKKGRRPLHYVILNEDLESSIAQLLSAGAIIDGQDEDGATPLHYAVSSAKATEDTNIFKKCLRAVYTLISCGADTSIPTSDGELPLHTAIYLEQNIRLNLVLTLLDMGAKVNAVNRRKETALHKAAWHWNVHAVNFLVQKGATLDARHEEGNTPLHKAVMELGASHGWRLQSFTNCIFALLNAGANPVLENAAGQTPKHVILGEKSRDRQFDSLELLHRANLVIRDLGVAESIYYLSLRGRRAPDQETEDDSGRAGSDRIPCAEQKDADEGMRAG